MKKCDWFDTAKREKFAKYVYDRKLCCSFKWHLNKITASASCLWFGLSNSSPLIILSWHTTNIPHLTCFWIAGEFFSFFKSRWFNTGGCVCFACYKVPTLSFQLNQDPVNYHVQLSIVYLLASRPGSSSLACSFIKVLEKSQTTLAISTKFQK